MFRPKITDLFGGVSTLSVATDGLTELPAVSGSRPPYLFTKGENRMNGSSAVAYSLMALAPILLTKDGGRLYPKLMVLIFTKDPS